MRPCAKASCALALLLALAGCAFSPNPSQVTNITYPPEAKTWILNRAMAEWRDWGSPVFDAQGRPIWGTTASSYLREDQYPAFPKVQAYWSIFDDQEEYIERQRRVYQTRSKTGKCQPDEQTGAADNHLWGCRPWSAAFVSFVMQTAGIYQNEFTRGAGHRVYVDYLVDVAEAAKRRNVRPTFEPFEVSQYAPRTGDLVCADRTENVGSRITTLVQRQAERRRAAERGDKAAGRVMHCDIVMSIEQGTSKTANVVYVLGGNVHDTVACVAYPLDADGRLAANDSRTWFAVFRNTIPASPAAMSAATPSDSSPSPGCARPTNVLVSQLAN